MSSRFNEIQALVKRAQSPSNSPSDWVHETVCLLVEIDFLIKDLSQKVERYRTALEKIAKPTYGTELCNTEEENNAILAPWVFIYQNTAREALEGKHD